MDTQYIAEKIRCTEEEKHSCMDTVKKLLTLIQAARCRGLLELESLVENEKYSSPALIRLGVQLIVDGTDPSIVQEIFENYMITSRLTNREFLESMLAGTGILAMQQGENPEHIKEKLCSLFGLEFRDAFLDYFKQERIEQALEEAYELHKEKLDMFHKTRRLDFIPEQMDDRSIQRVIREISPPALEIALAGSHSKVIKRFLNNMGKRRQQQFWDDIHCLKDLEPYVIEKSQQEIRSIAEKLEEQGEIILCIGTNRT